MREVAMKSLIGLYCLFVSSIALSGEIRLDSHNKVEWVATGSPGFLTIEGKGGRVHGTVVSDDSGKISGEFFVNVKKFTTGLKLRDKHMRKTYLSAKKHPKATFKMDPTSMDSKVVSGTMTIKGVSKRISGNLKTRKTSGGLTVATVNMILILDDYEIDVPEYLGVTVAKDVEVTIRLAFKV